VLTAATAGTLASQGGRSQVPSLVQRPAEIPGNQGPARPKHPQPGRTGGTGITLSPRAANGHGGDLLRGRRTSRGSWAAGSGKASRGGRAGPGLGCAEAEYLVPGELEFHANAGFVALATVTPEGNKYAAQS
jgi:hypothetical protein